MASLTFGEFQFSCALHLIHADPFLIPYTKHYFFTTPHRSLNRAGWITGITDASIQLQTRKLECEFTSAVDLSSLGTEIKSTGVDGFEFLCMLVSNTLEVSNGC